MTTVAYRDGVFAFDSLACYDNGDVHSTEYKKYIIKNDKTLYFAVGTSSILNHYDNLLDLKGLYTESLKHQDMESGERIAENYKEFFDKEIREKFEHSEFISVEIKNSKLLFKKFVSNRTIPERYECYIGSDHLNSWGSGSCFARGAMAAGSTSREAVSIASKLEVWTNDNIRSVKIEDNKFVEVE